MVAYVFGDWIYAILISTGQCLLLFSSSFFLARKWRSVSGPSDSPCPQAVINYRHVSPAQTPPSLPPLCDTGHIIILTSNRNASAISVLGGISPPAFCQPALSGISAVETHTECTKAQRKIHTCDERAGVVLFPVRRKRGWKHVRIFWEPTDTTKLVESVVRHPVVQ